MRINLQSIEIDPMTCYTAQPVRFRRPARGHSLRILRERIYKLPSLLVLSPKCMKNAKHKYNSIFTSIIPAFKDSSKRWLTSRSKIYSPSIRKYRKIIWLISKWRIIGIKIGTDKIWGHCSNHNNIN